MRAAGTGERGTWPSIDGLRGGAAHLRSAQLPRDIGDGSAGDGPTAELEILRGDLGQILFEHTADRVPYRFGDHVVTLDDDGRRVRVGVEHGPEEEFDLVVAADGVRSGTREIAMPGRADIRFLGLCMAYFTIPRDDTDTDWWRWYAAGEGRTITLRPDRHGTTRVLLSFLSPSSAPARTSPAAQQELLLAEFTGAGWQADRVLDGLGSALGPLLRGHQPGPVPDLRERPRRAPRRRGLVRLADHREGHDAGPARRLRAGR